MNQPRLRDTAHQSRDVTDPFPENSLLVEVSISKEEVL